MLMLFQSFIYFSAKKSDKTQQQMQTNQWVTNGTLGSKDAVRNFSYFFLIYH